MLRFAEDIKGVVVIALDSNRRVAVASDVVVDPNDLSIAAFICLPRAGAGQESFLLTKDIFRFTSGSISIQNETALSSAEDLVSLENLMRINFQLVGKKVHTSSGKKLGTVREYVFDDQGFKIIKLYVNPPFTRLMTSSDLIISRSQIVEVNDTTVVVKDALVKKTEFFSAVVDA